MSAMGLPANSITMSPPRRPPSSAGLPARTPVSRTPVSRGVISGMDPRYAAPYPLVEEALPPPVESFLKTVARHPILQRAKQYEP